MVQFFKGSPDPRDAATGALATALGQGLGKGITSHFANKSLDKVINDESFKSAPISVKQGMLHSALFQFGDTGKELFQNRLQGELLADQEQHQKRETEALEKMGLGDLSKLPPELKKIAFAEIQKGIQKQTLQNQREQYANQIISKGQEGTNPSQQIQQQPVNNATSQENFPEKGLPYTNEEIIKATVADPSGRLAQQMRAQNEIIEKRNLENRKLKERKGESVRNETLPYKLDISQKADAAKQGIRNKEGLLDIIKKGDIDDPTYATIADIIPFNLGQRLLSNDTVEYRSGLIDEYKDLRNIFQGQTRVKEIELLEKKIPDLYLTNSQKETILKSRINALQADVIREEVASEMEEEGLNLPILQYKKELNRRLQPRITALSDRIIDENNAVIKDAENRKKIPLRADDPEGQEIIDQILKEVGGDPKKAAQRAKKLGYTF